MMSPRRKRLLTFFLICFAPLLILAVINYWNGLRMVDLTLNSTLQDNVNGLIEQIDRNLQENETDLTRASLSAPVQQLAVNEQTANDQLPLLRAVLGSLLSRQTHLVHLSLFDASGSELFSAERRTGDPEIRTTTRGMAALTRSSVAAKQRSVALTGQDVNLTVPVSDEKGHDLTGSLVGDVDLAELFSDAAATLESRANTQASIIAVFDQKGGILYHTNHVLQGQQADRALPEFRDIVAQAKANQSGLQSFIAPNGKSYTAAFAPLPRLSISVAVARERSALAASAHHWGIAGLVLALAMAAVGAISWERYVDRKSRSIERVTEDLNAIAKGELDRRIELRSTDDARAIADNINVVTERLRTQLAREAESRQFDSFVRLSAMLTHDLKNAIEALSLTVGNMEQHFDNEQFRHDAMRSVASATDKLKAIVARLTRPLTSLSGEHKRPIRVDLIPILQRAVSQIAEPVARRHQIELNLPNHLYALVDGEKIATVVENLVLNALESMSEKSGTLTITAAEADSETVAFSVSDTGVGMSQTFIEQRLFHPFATTKRRGVGLGLYTCREVIQANSGKIEVTSQQGVGTTFRVVLPSPSPDGSHS